MTKDNQDASIGKWTEITSLTFDGGFAFYPLRIYKDNENGPINKVFTAQFGYNTNQTRWTMFSGAIYNDKRYFTLNSKATNWTPQPFAEFYPGTLGKNAARPYYWSSSDTKQPRYPLWSQPLDITVKFSRDIAPTVKSISVSPGDYYPGEYIPIVVHYTEPVKAGTKLTVNGIDYIAREKSASNKQTFLYKVEEKSSIDLIVTGLDAKNLDDKEMDHSAFFKESGGQNSNDSSYTIKAHGVDIKKVLNVESDKGFIIHPITNRKAFTGIAATIDNTDIQNPQMNVEVSIIDDETFTAWLANDFEIIPSSPDFKSKSLFVKITNNIDYTSDYLELKSSTQDINGKTLELVNPLNLQGNTSGEEVYYVAELFVANENFDNTVPLTDDMFDPVIGTYQDRPLGLAFDTIASMILFTRPEMELKLTLSVLKEDKITPYEYKDKYHKIYLEEKPYVIASYEIIGKRQYTYKDTNDFEWTSSDTEIANIQSVPSDGNNFVVITPTGTKDGEVTFTLTARNGNPAKEVSLSTETIHFASGTTPYMTVDLPDYEINDGEEITLAWGSNIATNNGTTPTIFSIDIFRGDRMSEPGIPNGEHIHREVSATAANPVSSYKTSKDDLKYQYDGIDNVYTIVISTTYKNILYSGKVKVTIDPLPAVVTLTKPNNYYLKDTAGPVQVKWNIENFAGYSSGNNVNGEFELKITRITGKKMAGSDIFEEEVVYTSNDPGTSGNSGGKYSGSYVIAANDLKVENYGFKDGFRHTYIVSVKVKNGKDGTWSTDSYVFYVYDADALKIWLQETTAEDRNEKITGRIVNYSDEKNPSSLRMTNVDSLDDLVYSTYAYHSLRFGTDAEKAAFRDTILGYKRNISLRNMISANYDDYAWTELADQIKWESSANSVATINYKQGSLYNNITSLSYTSYRPATDLLLSGLKSGDTTITATHLLTEMSSSLDVQVETLKDRLYIFQCYPRTKTYITFYLKGEEGYPKQVVSNDEGAAVIYLEDGWEFGDDIYFKSEFDGHVYLGTYYRKDLKSGEGDSTKLELYPVNTLTLRRAAYAYLYVKNPDGTPYTGSVMFRGGVYINDEEAYLKPGYAAGLGAYNSGIRFDLNPTNTSTADKMGNVDNFTTPLGESGKLEIAMDLTQIEDVMNRELTAEDKLSYVFLISASEDGKTESAKYYPMYIYIDSNASEDKMISNGEAVVNFKQNKQTDRHPFIVEQYVEMFTPWKAGERTSLGKNSVHDKAGSVGITDSYPQAKLETIVMWWGEEPSANDAYALKMFTSEGVELVSEYYSTQSITKYPFTKNPITSYTVDMEENSLNISVPKKQKKTLYLDYYRVEDKLSRREDMSFAITNLIDCGKTEDSKDLQSALKNAGKSINTDSKDANKADSKDDDFVSGSLNLLSNLQFTDADDMLISLNISPTTDPTKFMGLMKFKVSNMDDIEHPNGVEIIGQDSSSEFEYKPNIEDLPYGGAKKWLDESKQEIMDAKDDIISNDIDVGYEVGGYMEVLIYWDFDDQIWKMQVVDGGFNVGAGLEVSWNWNVMVGPVPLTMEIKLGGQLRVNMDAVTTAYQNSKTNQMELATEYLTKLRLYLYIYVFAGVGIDYSVVALKLGVFGQLSLDMTFAWLNRPYLEEHKNDGVKMLANPDDPVSPANLNGQNFRIDGMVGLKFVATVACIEYEKILFSVAFNCMDEYTGQYKDIERLWGNNQDNLREAINALVSNGSASLMNINGQQYMAVDLAAKVEGRDYLNDPDNPRIWYGDKKKKELVSLAGNRISNITTMETNSYPYADPKILAYGDEYVFISDMGRDVNGSRAVYVNSNGGAPQVIDDNGNGDTQVSAASSGYGDRVAAWTRYEKPLDVPANATLAELETKQTERLNSSEIYASVYSSSKGWQTTRLTDNSEADVAPVVVARGNKAIVAWRNVAGSGKTKKDANGNDYLDVTDFDKKDTILYKVYENGKWSDKPICLYNGSSGSVKSISAAMLDNGTTAVAYTLETGNGSSSREIVYTIIDEFGDMRSVRVTSDDKLDENPQIIPIKYQNWGWESFVLAWYTQEMKETKTSKESGGKSATSDICILDIDRNGNIGNRLPATLSQVAEGDDINVSSNFKFGKNHNGGYNTINDLSIVWVERIEEDTASGRIEKDVLKAVKFFDYYANYETAIGLTDSIVVANMPNGTLIDSFDAYSEENEVTAVILGTTYGANGTEWKTSVLQGQSSNTVSYLIPTMTSTMYKALGTFTNMISVPSVSIDYNTIKRAGSTFIRFNVKNEGKDKINQIRIEIDGVETAYPEDNAYVAPNLGLLPGDTTTIWVEYNIPNDRIIDPDYKVTAIFDADTGDTDVVTGTLKLNNPDLEITDAQIVGEEDGERVIQLKLNNALDAALAGSGKKVGISFYSDVTMQKEIDQKYLRSIIIENDNELKMIDEGGYSVQAVFDIAGYVKDLQKKTEEIPDSGVPVYISANILSDKYDSNGQRVSGEYVAEPEPEISNNTAQVDCDNLKARTGQDVILTSDIDVKNGETTVFVEIQNTRISETVTGNLIVSLLDDNGNVIEQQQSYKGRNSTAAARRNMLHVLAADNLLITKAGLFNGNTISNFFKYTVPATDNNGLITLGMEERVDRTFTFNKEGASVDITYSDLKLDADNSNLSSVSFGAFKGINKDSFTDQGNGTFVAEVQSFDSTSTTVIASAESGLSSVSIVGSDEEDAGETNTIGEGNSLSKTVPLIPNLKGSTITVTVTADDGTKQVYILKIKYYTCMVTFNDYDENYMGYHEICPSVEVMPGDYIDEPDIPVKDGYIFIGWNTPMLGEIFDFVHNPILYPMEFFAEWHQLTGNRVSFDTDGGSKVYDQDIANGGKVTKPTDPVKSHNTFIGWYKDKNCTTEWNFDTETITADTTIYAKWKEDVKYTVTFNTNGGSAVASISAFNGEKVERPADPTKNGYTFKGWYSDQELTKLWSFNNDTVSSNITLYAKWDGSGPAKPDPVPDNPTPTITPAPTATPTPTPVTEENKKVTISKAEKTRNGLRLDKGMSITPKGKKKLVLKWGEVKDADIYEVYVGYYGKALNKIKPIVVEGAENTTKTISKIDGKKIDAKKNIKYRVYAYKYVDGKKVLLGKSLELYVAGSQSEKYTNVSKVTLNKKSVKLKVGDTFKLKAELKLEDDRKKMVTKSKVAKVRYISSDTSVATVDSKGNITAVGKGTCNIYAYSRNGAFAKIKVKVK